MSNERDDPVKEGELEGRYANSFNIGFNALEVLVEFGQLYLEGGQAFVHTRIITSPAYAKALSSLLRGAVEDYERKFGPIQGA